MSSVHQLKHLQGFNIATGYPKWTDLGHRLAYETLIGNDDLFNRATSSLTIFFGWSLTIFELFSTRSFDVDHGDEF
jgi:hypothetical protein